MIWIKRLNNYGISNWVILLLFILSFFAMIAQVVGLGIFLPIFEFIFQGGVDQSDGGQNLMLRYINLLISFMNIDVTLESLLILAFIFYLTSQLLLFIIAYANSYFIGRMTKNIRDKFFKYYLDADSEYYDRVKIGNFINISTSELGLAVSGVIAPIKLMVSLISGVGSIVILSALSYELTIYICIIILIVLPYPMVLISRATKLGRTNTRYNSFLVSFLLDRLKSPRLVRLSGTRNSEIREYFNITEKQRSLTLSVHILKEKVVLIFEPVIIFSSLVMLYIAITYLDISPSSTLLFMVITVKLVPIIRSVLMQKQSINRTKGAIESIDSLILNMKLKDNSCNFSGDDYNDIVALGPTTSIQLQDISYRYSNTNKDTLSHISLTFDHGTINGIIGPSGSGKSTLIDIISSYRMPNKGSVYFNDKKLSEFKINSLISYVPQQPQIFDGQVVNHISYGTSDQLLSNVKDAAILAGAHDFIMKFDNQYQTLLNNNGGNLSGGQRYRLDMARALLSNTPILILDEPTSALDYENKIKFVNTIKKIKNETGKIIIVITHDFSITPIFDSIVLLEDGLMVSQSTHDDLINISSWYSSGVSDFYKNKV